MKGKELRELRERRELKVQMRLSKRSAWISHAIIILILFFLAPAVAGADEAAEVATSAPFLQSLIIILREGFEAILIISAIATYLIRSGNREKVRTVYSGAIAAVFASLATAVVIRFLFSGTKTFGKEVIEGATMLLAVAVLFWVSYWLTGKAQARKWQEYIERRVKASITTGSAFALAAAAFLAVYREGAETILFYEALITGNRAAAGSIVLGFITGSVALVGVFLAFRYGSFRIPLKPFFLATGSLLYFLAFIFAGQGIKELQQAGVVSATHIGRAPTIDALGIYPTLQTLLLQTVLVLAAIGAFVWQFLRSRKKPPISTETIQREQGQRVV